MRYTIYATLDISKIGVAAQKKMQHLMVKDMLSKGIEVTERRRIKYEEAEAASKDLGGDGQRKLPEIAGARALQAEKGNPEVRKGIRGFKATGAAMCALVPSVT